MEPHPAGLGPPVGALQLQPLYQAWHHQDLEAKQRLALVALKALVALVALVAHLVKLVSPVLDLQPVAQDHHLHDHHVVADILNYFLFNFI